MRAAPRLAAPTGIKRRNGGMTVTAAGSLPGGSNAFGALGTGAQTPARQAWQFEAWGYADAMPELHYGMQFVGSCMSRIKLRLGWLTDNNDVAPVFNEDGNIDEDCPVDPQIIANASAVLAAFRDPLGGPAALLEQLGKNLTVTGEAHLLARDLHDENGTVVSRRWEVLSTDEIRRRGSVKRDKEGKLLEPEFERVWGAGRPNEPIDPKTSFVLRIYRRHPRWSHIADAATRPLLDIMEVLVLLARQLRATVLSRLAGAGVLWIPSEMDLPDDETAPEGTEEEDPFARKLFKNMTTPISDRGSASSVVPLVIRADADLIPAVHHLTFETKDDEVAMHKMATLLQRFAQGMDLPVEVILGHQQTTFANAVQVDESTFKAHLEPMIELICGFLTAGYLWGSLGVKRPVDAPYDEPTLIPLPGQEVARLVITYDASALVTHENREKNAIEAGIKSKPPIIGPSSTRRALGFSDADALTDEERDEWIRVQQLIGVKETIRAEEQGAGEISLADQDVQTALDPGTQLPEADNAVIGTQ